VEFTEKLILAVIVAIITLIFNIIIEWFNNRSKRIIESQKMLWEMKSPVYMQLAEDVEELFHLENATKDFGKAFNKLCNKIYLAGNDDVVIKLNQNFGGPEAIDGVGQILFNLRKELNPKTIIKAQDYKRKTISATPIQ